MRLRDGSTTRDVRLDRLEHFDPRSRSYPLRSVLADDATVRQKTWGIPRRELLDQGREGACVSTAVTHEIKAEPVAQRVGLDMDWARERVYHEAQKIDPWEGGSYPGASPQYEGTSVLAGLKVAQAMGFYVSYRWTFTIDDLLRGLANEGPGVLGLAWLDGMFAPRRSGLLEVVGGVAGGHAVAAVGVWMPAYARRLLREPDITEPIVVVAQSWGLDHGRRGIVFVQAPDMQRLLGMRGEAAFPVGRRVATR